MFVLTPSRSAHRAALAPQFSRAADRLFEQSLARIFNDTPAPEPKRTPVLDVRETDSAYVLAFEVPGVTREQLKVSVEGRRVSVESVDAAASVPTDAAPATEVPDGPRVLYRERTGAKFARTVSLPTEVDHGASEAKFDNGVLTLTLAKKVPAGAIRLAVN